MTKNEALQVLLEDNSGVAFRVSADETWVLLLHEDTLMAVMTQKSGNLAVAVVQHGIFSEFDRMAKAMKHVDFKHDDMIIFSQIILPHLKASYQEALESEETSTNLSRAYIQELLNEPSKLMEFPTGLLQ